MKLADDKRLPVVEFKDVHQRAVHAHGQHDTLAVTAGRERRRSQDGEGWEAVRWREALIVLPEDRSITAAKSDQHAVAGGSGKLLPHPQRI